MPDIFGPGSNYKQRLVESYPRLAEIVKSLRKLGLKVVLVLGTYDLAHIGHARYLEQAKELGAVVIVGVDPDEAVKKRKGPRRPIVPLEERLEMLTHLRHVDLVTVTTDIGDDGVTGYQLIETIKPDIFVMSETTTGIFTDEQRAIIKKNTGKVVVLPAQAETSTSAKVRLLTLDIAEKIKKSLDVILESE